MERVYELFQKLPDELKREVIDYNRVLIRREIKEKKRTA